MKSRQKHTKYAFRDTDLALERKRVRAKDGGILYKEGVRDGVRLSALTVKEGAKEDGHPAGKTLSLSFSSPYLWDEGERRAVRDAFALGLKYFFPTLPSRLLVTGLGNRRLTADSLGPVTAEGVEVSAVLPEELLAKFEIPITTRVAVYVPDVFSKTGMESARLIEGAARLFQADAVLAFDALAARERERLFRVVEITDTGTVPGGGVKQGALSLSRESLGIPVIAVGVPTVVRVDEEHFLVIRDMEECVREIASLLSETVNLVFEGGDAPSDSAVADLFEEEARI